MIMLIDTRLIHLSKNHIHSHQSPERRIKNLRHAFINKSIITKQTRRLDHDDSTRRSKLIGNSLVACICDCSAYNTVHSRSKQVRMACIYDPSECEWRASTIPASAMLCIYRSAGCKCHSDIGLSELYAMHLRSLRVQWRAFTIQASADCVHLPLS